MEEYNVEAGSFRDRNGRVFYNNGNVFRGLSAEALKDWKSLSSKKFLPRLIAEKKLIHTVQVDDLQEFGLYMKNRWAGILKHETIPFISYPYEWSFGMLKDAALLQLELLLAALNEDMILKDSSAFNVQWKGSNPVFIDIPSFMNLEPGEPWVGYRQFCEMFLYPLLLQAYKDVPFQPWLRGNIDGIKVEHCRSLISLRDIFRRGVFLHVFIQSKFQEKYGQTKKDVKRDLISIGFNKEMIERNVNNLKKIIHGMNWKRSASEWANYIKSHSYTDHDHEIKKEFVRDIVKSHSWEMVWDIGCNTGTFSRIALENAKYVVAMDADHLAIDQLYKELNADGCTSILPLVVNLADPSPNLGWRGLERKSLHHRGKPDLILCLALIHHMVISANIPL